MYHLRSCACSPRTRTPSPPSSKRRGRRCSVRPRFRRRLGQRAVGGARADLENLAGVALNDAVVLWDDEEEHARTRQRVELGASDVAADVRAVIEIKMHDHAGLDEPEKSHVVVG